MNRRDRRAHKARHGWLPLERAAYKPKTAEQLQALFDHTKRTFPQYTDAELSKALRDGEGELGEIWKNDIYQVHVIRHAGRGPNCDMIQLSIKRLDQQPARDWRDLQRIKNQLVGPECEGVELYPAQSRLVDTANQFHLWVVDSPAYRWPVGYTTRHVSGESGGGAVQRPFEEEPVTSETDPYATIARAARDLLDLYAREPALFARVMKLLSPQDIETLRKVATWDTEDPDYE